MKTLPNVLAIVLACSTLTTLHAQGTTTKTPMINSGGSVNGGVELTQDTLGQLGQMLHDGSLATILSNPELARSLGLDLEQWIMAQTLIEEYQRLTMMYMMLDPEGLNPATWQTVSMLQFYLDLQLYYLLTPGQQQLLDQIYQQLTVTQGSSAANGTPTKPIGK